MQLKVFLCCLLLPVVNAQQRQPCSDATTCALQALQANLRPETSPCEDFWTHACGNWQQAHARQTTFMDNFDIALDKYAEQLRVCLQQPSDAAQSATPRLLAQLQTYYAACRQLPGRRLQMAHYMRALPQELQALRADLVSAVQLPEGDWLSAAAAVRKFGLNGVFLAESVGVASDDAQRYAVQLSMPDEDVYFSSAAELRGYMRHCALCPGCTHTQAWDVAAQLYAFERQLSALSGRQRGAAPLESVLQLSTLRQRVPQLDWQRYFSLLLERAAPPDLRLEVADLPYLQALGALLQRTSRRLSRLYLLLRLCKFLHDSRPQLRDDKQCVAHMGIVLPLGMNHIYERCVYGAQRSRDAPALQTLLAQLKATFAGYLQANRLQLLPPQLAYLRRKLQGLQLQVGNLPLHAELPWYDAHYGGLNLSATDFYWNHWQVLRFRTRLQHTQLQAHDAATSYVNDDIQQLRTAPYYMPQRNTLLVPLVFMQAPFYERQQHALLQHSLMGWILAHELSHAFEADGVVFDAAGNESPVGLAISQRPSFRQAQACLNRSATAALRERVADVNGFQLAYDAYFDAAADAAEAAGHSSPVSPTHTARQLFFLHFAQFFCGRLPTAIAHDADDVRVATVVAHMPEFAQDFNCARQPAAVCQMWRTR